MKKITLFGKSLAVIIKKSSEDKVVLRRSKLFVYICKEEPENLIKDFLSSMLYKELYNIYEKIKKSGRIQVLGDIDFDIVNSIDGKKRRIAKIKGHTILVKLDAVKLPKRALKYVVAHELAHISIKRHTEKFWNLLATIYPNYEYGSRLLDKYQSLD